MLNADKDALLPCPFCGDRDDFNPSLSQSHKYAEPGEAETGTVGNPDAGLVPAGYYVECDKCGACGANEDTETEAIAAWNLRPDPAPKSAPTASGDVERIAEAIHDARFGDEGRRAINWMPFSTEDQRGREYCFRLARAALTPTAPLPESAGEWPEPDVDASLARLKRQSVVLTADRITPVETPPKPAPGDVAGLIEGVLRANKALRGYLALGNYKAAGQEIATALTRTEQAESSTSPTPRGAGE